MSGSPIQRKPKVTLLQRNPTSTLQGPSPAQQHAAHEEALRRSDSCALLAPPLQTQSEDDVKGLVLGWSRSSVSQPKREDAASQRIPDVHLQPRKPSTTTTLLRPGTTSLSQHPQATQMAVGATSQVCVSPQPIVVGTKRERETDSAFPNDDPPTPRALQYTPSTSPTPLERMAPPAPDIGALDNKGGPRHQAHHPAVAETETEPNAHHIRCDDVLYQRHHVAARPVELQELLLNATAAVGSRTHLHQQQLPNQLHTADTSGNPPPPNPYNIPFPFQPYPLQTRAMNLIRATLEAGHVNRGSLVSIRELEGQRIRIYGELRKVRAAMLRSSGDSGAQWGDGGALSALRALLAAGGHYAQHLFQTVRQSRSTSVGNDVVCAADATGGDATVSFDGRCLPIVVEAPTGTGKTHVLLNSILSWLSLERYKEALRLREQLRVEKGRVRQAILEGRAWRREMAAKGLLRGGGRRDSKIKAEVNLEGGGDVWDELALGDGYGRNARSSGPKKRNVWSSSSDDGDEDGVALGRKCDGPEPSDNPEVLRVQLDDDEDGVIRDEDYFELAVREIGDHIAPVTPKVWFSSRTHTQLQQCSDEMRSTVFGKAVTEVGGAFRPFAIPQSTLLRFPETQESSSEALRMHGGSDWVTARNELIDRQVVAVFNALLDNTNEECAVGSVDGWGNTPQRFPHHSSASDLVQQELAKLEFYFDDIYRNGLGASPTISLSDVATSSDAARLLFKDEDHHAHIVPNAPTHAVTPVMPLSFVHITARNQLCINDHVKKKSLGNSQQLNEQCKMDMEAYRKYKMGVKKERSESEAASTSFTTSFMANNGGEDAHTTEGYVEGVALGAEEGAIPEGADPEFPASSLPPLVDMEDFTGLRADGTPVPGSKRASGFYCDGCPYSSHARLKILRGEMRRRNLTMPEVRAMGKKLGACPYLASKQMVRAADVVFVHFNNLVDSGMRNGLLNEEPISGLSAVESTIPTQQNPDREMSQLRKNIVRRAPSPTEDPNTKKKKLGVLGVKKAAPLSMLGDVVVFDEGHNVVDNSRKSLRVEISYGSLRRFKNMFSRYLEQYQNRLLGRNQAVLRDMIKQVSNLQRFMMKRHVANCTQHLLVDFVKYQQERRKGAPQEGHEEGDQPQDRRGFSKASDLLQRSTITASAEYGDERERSRFIAAAHKDPLFAHFDLDDTNSISPSTMGDLFSAYCTVPGVGNRTNDALSGGKGSGASGEKKTEYTIGGKVVVSHHHRFSSFLFNAGVDNVRFDSFLAFIEEYGVSRKVRYFANMHTEHMVKEYQRHHSQHLFADGSDKSPKGISSRKSTTLRAPPPAARWSPLFNVIGFGHPAFGALRFRSAMFPLPPSVNVERGSALPPSSVAAEMLYEQGASRGENPFLSQAHQSSGSTTMQPSDDDARRSEVRHRRRRCAEIGAQFTDEEDSDGDECWRELPHGRNHPAKELEMEQRFDPEANVFWNHYRMSLLSPKDRLQALNDWKNREFVCNNRAVFDVLHLFEVLSSLVSGCHVMVLRDEEEEKIPSAFHKNEASSKAAASRFLFGAQPVEVFPPPSPARPFHVLSCFGAPDEGSVWDTARREAKGPTSETFKSWLDMPAHRFTASSKFTHPTTGPSKGSLLPSRVRRPPGSARLRLVIIPTDVSQLLKPMSCKLRSIVVTGGTLTPLELTCDPLFGADNFLFRSFKHIVDVRRNLRLFTISRGPSALSPSALRLIHGPGGGGGYRPPARGETEFRFTYSSQRTHEQRTLLVNAAMNVVFEAAREIPHGLIIFFPSYAKQQEFWVALKAAHGGALFHALNNFKRVFIEEQASSASVAAAAPKLSGDALLQAYTAYVEGTAEEPLPAGMTYRGALLSCVMSGRLAEGINFNDHLGRGVIVFGIPHATIYDAESLILMSDLAIVQRRAHLEKQLQKAPNALPSDPSRRAQEDDDVADIVFGDGCNNRSANSTVSPHAVLSDVERLRWSLQLATAMRAVNQAIGRCIRRFDDYATIFLCDSRYNEQPKSNAVGLSTAAQNLPKWMLPARIECSSNHAFEEIVLPELRTFFRDKGHSPPSQDPSR